MTVLERLPAPFKAVGEHIEIALPGGRALFTTRAGGFSHGAYASLNLGLTAPAAPGTSGDDPGHVAENRHRVAALTGISGERFAHARQVHGSTVVRVRAPPAAAWTERGLLAHQQADGHATALGDVAVVVLVADCLPIALIAAGAVAMLHAGWRGLAGGVVAEGVRALRELGAEGPLAAAVGPGAGRCCYEVGEEVHSVFAHHGAQVRAGRRLDLPAIATRELAASGVDSVHDVGLCTMCSSEFFSHRRELGITGRQGGVAWRS